MTPVVTVSSRQPRGDEPYYRPMALVKSLRRFGAEPITLGMNGDWGGLMTKPLLFREWLRGCEPDKRVILTDAWDVIFADSPDSVANRCAAEFGGAVVFNTEKSCWPLAELAVHFPDEGTPWRYLNGGVMCGLAGDLLTMFESMNLESYGLDRWSDDGKRIEPNDAVPLVMAYVKQPVPIVVDAKCKVFQCFSECKADEFTWATEDVHDFSTGRNVQYFMNKITGTCPGVLHFNGGSKNDLMPTIMNAMEL